MHVGILARSRAFGQNEHQVLTVLHDCSDLLLMQFLTLEGSRRLGGDVKNCRLPSTPLGFCSRWFHVDGTAYNTPLYTRIRPVWHLPLS